MVYIPILKLFVDKYEVSFFLFEELMGKKRKKSGIPLIKNLTPQHPAITSYDEAVNYCDQKGMRLLTEDEWEIVAGRDLGYIYSWGKDEVDHNNDFKANYEDIEWDGHSEIAVVNSYEDYASPYGIVNLSGNVWEWVLYMRCKGGGFLSDKEELKIEAYATKKSFVGFRCAMEVELKEGEND
jgi:formylglycine-generating enzyme required for sulfatase activity